MKTEIRDIAGKLYQTGLRETSGQKKISSGM